MFFFFLLVDVNKTKCMHVFGSHISSAGCEPLVGLSRLISLLLCCAAAPQVVRQRGTTFVAGPVRRWGRSSVSPAQMSRSCLPIPKVNDSTHTDDHMLARFSLLFVCLFVCSQPEPAFCLLFFLSRVLLHLFVLNM